MSAGETQRTRTGVVAVLTGVTALGSISVSIYLPSLPVIAQSLHASVASSKLTLTGFLVVFALMQLVYGPFSDRFGRKGPMLLGVAVYLLGSLACAAAPNIGFLIGGRIIQATGASAGPALGRAVLRDLFERSELASALAMVAAAVALSPMLGPFAGGAIAVSFGWRAIFLALAAAGVILGLLVWRSVPDTATGRDVSATRLATMASRYVTLLGDREFASAVLCGGCLTAGNFAWNASAPFLFATRYNVAADQYGSLSLLIGGGYVIGTLAAARLSKQMTAPMLVYSGLAASLAASAALTVFAANGTSGVWALVATAALNSAGMGIVIPSATACALSRKPEIAGSAAGLSGALQILTGALGTFAAGLFTAGSFVPVGAIMTACAIAAFWFGYVALFPFREQIVVVQAHHHA